MKKIIIFVLYSFSFLTLAAEDKTAKIILLKGKVHLKNSNQQLSDVLENQDVSVGDTLITEDKSVAKLLFIDKSQIVLGPNSEMKIANFDKSNPGILNLIKGQIRSKVSKDYLENKDKEKSKLYIQTKSAAMGVRGTDFQVIFNEINFNTALITFEGRVMFSNIDRNEHAEHFDQRDLEKIITNENSVLVTEGKISAVNLNIAARAMTPTSLGINQLKALEKNDILLLSDKQEKNSAPQAQYRNPIPPGVDSKTFTNISEKQLSDVNENMKSANGFFNIKSGEYKLPAGSIIDLKTVNLVPPPTNAVFDPNSKTFVVPEEYGKINKETGEYVSPAGLKLNDQGKFQIIDQSAYLKSKEVNKDKQDTPRAPASISAKLEIKIEAPKLYDANKEMSTFSNQFNQSNAPDMNRLSDQLKNTIDERITNTQAQRDTSTSLGNSGTSRNVQFNIDVQ